METYIRVFIKIDKLSIRIRGILDESKADKEGGGKTKKKRRVRGKYS